MPGNRIRDAVVVITGASSGIGRASALEFARRGATLLLAARREAPLESLVQECAQLGVLASAHPLDVTDEKAVGELAQKALDEHGRLDVWVNNAAVSLFGRFEESPPDAWRRVIETNLFGYTHGARAALPRFREQGHGVLINVSSGVGKTGQPYTSAYATSKFAIAGLSACLREELLDEDIHVCTISPGSIDTPLFQYAANFTGRAVKPIDPIIDPARVAKAIVSCARSPRREVVVGISTKQLVGMSAVMPGLVERQVARKVDKDHFQDRSAPPTWGNLFQPQPEWTSVDGGWKRAKQQQRRRLAPAALAAVGVAIPALLAWWRAREMGLAETVREAASRAPARDQTSRRDGIASWLS